MNLRRLAGYGPAFVLAITLLACWELYVRAGMVNQEFLPSPTAIAMALSSDWDAIYVNTVPTFLEAILGITAATLLGLLLAIVLDTSDWLRRAIYPLLVISQTVPIVALGPLLLIWFGLDMGPKVIVVTLYCFFPVAVACVDGLAATDPDLLRLMRSMSASRWQVLLLVRLPGALPSFFSGLRIAATYSVVGAIFGEYVGAYMGLGVYIQAAAQARAVDQVFAAILVISALTLVLFGAVSLLERLTLPWYHGTRSRSLT